MQKVDYKPVKPVPINIGDQERFLKYTFKSAGIVKQLTGKSLFELESIENDELVELIVPLIYAGLVWKEKELKPDDIADQLEITNVEYYVGCVMQAFGAQLTPADEAPGDDPKPKNAEADQQAA